MANKDKKNKTSFDFGNTAAEKWSKPMTEKFFNDALDIAKKDDTFHVSDIAAQLDTYYEIFDYLIKKFPVFLIVKKRIDSLLLSRLQKGALMRDLDSGFTKFHLSSNYKWSDKTETKNENVNKFEGLTPIVFFDGTDTDKQ